ncbi:hypothetical protein FQZ97_913670 [compost metagenome]
MLHALQRFVIPGWFGVVAAPALHVVQGEPSPVGQGDDALLDQLAVSLGLLLLAIEVVLEGIHQHDGQQFGRGSAAENWLLGSGNQQIENAPNVIDTHVSSDQGLDRILGKLS